MLVEGNDFYSSPRISPDGTKLAWLTWHHPNMPWDGTELWVGEIEEGGSIGEKEQVAGGVEESVFQPEWSPGGVLYFISDRTGWWNLYRINEAGETEAMCPMEAEFGLPQWVFGMSTYGFLSPDTIMCAYSSDGVSHLAKLNMETKTLDEQNPPYTYIGNLHAANGLAAFIGGSPKKLERVSMYDAETDAGQSLHISGNLEVDPGYISVPEAVEFPTENGVTAHGFYYAPKNIDYAAPEGEKPPLIVESHGGPTSATNSVLDLGIQYWTSRGIGVLDVNYGGSTGYGSAVPAEIERAVGRSGCG